MNSKELKAKIRNKLQTLRTTIEQLEKEKDVPKSIIEASVKDLNSLEESAELKKVLEIHRITCPVGKDDLVFCNKAGNPVDPSNFVKREFEPALMRAGFRKIRFHDLRHTYATFLIAQNENIKFIQSQLGHASIQTTMDRYGHILPNSYHGVGERLDKLVFGELSSVPLVQASRVQR